MLGHCIIPTLTAFFVCGSIHSQEATHPPRVEHELQHLYSDAAKEKISAAQILSLEFKGAKDMDYLWLLLKDSSINVRTEAAIAVTTIASNSDFEQYARSVASHLWKEIATNHNRIFEQGDASPEEKVLFAWNVLALDELRFWHPLVSVHDYDMWQEETIFTLVLSLNPSGHEPSEAVNSVLIGLLRSIKNPALSLRAFDAVFESTVELPPMFILGTLSMLKTHRLFGSNFPMRRNIVDLFMKKLPVLEEKALLIRDIPSRDEFYYYINEMKNEVKL